MTPSDEGPVLAHLFERDGHQFVVLPKGFLSEGVTEVEISGDSCRLILKPVAERPADEGRL